MDSSVAKSEFTVIRLGDSYTGNWPAEVRQAVGVLARFVDATLADAEGGPDASSTDPQTGAALREAAEREAAKRSDAETAHPEKHGDDGHPLRPRGSLCGAIDSAEVGADTAAFEIVLVRGRGAYETVSQALG